MPQTESTLDLLRKLRVPTFQPSPNDTKPVDSFADFFAAIEYTDKEFQVFVSTMLGSISTADVSSYPVGDARDNALDSISDALHSMLVTIQEKRSKKNRFYNIPSRLDSTQKYGDPKRKIEMAVEEAFERRFRDAHTLIGPIPLDPGMPVVEVEITETYSAQTTRTLRSNTDPVFKSHKSDMMMAITIEVPSNRINDRGEGQSSLLSLLATLKAFPVCEIVSSAITPVYVNSILAPEIFESIRQQVADEVANSNIQDIKDRSEQLKTLRSPAFGESLTAFKTFVGTLNPVLDFFIRNNENDTEALNKQDMPLALATNRLKTMKGAVSVPCAYMGCIVKTSPGKTNQMTVKLFFRRFNDQVWSPMGKIFYRDRLGKPTPNVTECPWIERIARMMFTNSVNNPGNYMRPYQPKLSEEEAGMVFSWPDPYSKDSSNPTAMVPVKYKPHGTDWVIQDIECRSFMKMVQLPMVGSPYPTAQYMGLDNLHAKITVTITNAVELARFHEMKAALDRLNYEAGPNSLRHHFVSIENNLLNFLGATDFVITGITTHRGSEEDVWHVEFEVLESTTSINESESIVLKDEAFLEKGDIKIIWDHIYNLLSEQAEADVSTLESLRRREFFALDSSKPNKYFRPFPRDANNPKSHELDAEGQMAWRLVFERAGNRGSGSILQPNIMAAAWYSLAMKSVHQTSRDDRRDFTSFPWNTGYKHDPRISAVMEGRAWDGPGAMFTNDRAGPIGDGDLGIFNSTSLVQSGGDVSKPEHFYITGKFNPASIFEFSHLSGTPGNRIANTDDNVWETWPKLTREERIIQSKAADWLSKGQYDISGYSIGVSNAIGDSAQRNIFEQGKEMLQLMGMGFYRATIFFSKEFWDEYFNILFNDEIRPDGAVYPAWSQTDIIDGRFKLTSLLRQGAYLDFPSLQKNKFATLADQTRFVRTNIDEEDLDNSKLNKDGKYEANKSNYADMKLPTYGRVFKDDTTGKLLMTPDNKELWREFAPTFSDLGIKPGYIRSIVFENVSDAINKVARKINDPIEPDSVYYHFRYKGEGLAKHIDNQGNLDAHLKEVNNHPRIRVPSSVSRGGSAGVDAYLKEVWKVPNERYMQEAFNRETDHQLLKQIKDKRITSITVIDEEGTLLGNVIPDTDSKQGIKFNSMPGMKYQIFSGDGQSVVDHYDGTEVSKAAKDLILRSDDRTGSMSRLFPAYRLYFIEQDRGYRYLADDLYGVNCLISLSIRKDKFDADILVATLSNTTDNLSTMRTLSASQTRALGLASDDAGEPYMSSLKLQSGVCVQLRMGYGSDPDDLPIIFTGMITEIEPGKIVEITCQGHKRELLNEVQFEMESINHFDIIRKVLEKTEHPNLGEDMTAGRFSNATLSTRFADGQNPDDYIGITDRWFNRKVVDMSNVYIVSNAPLESGRKVYFDRRDNFFEQKDVRAVLALPTAGASLFWGNNDGNGSSRLGNAARNIGEFVTKIYPDNYMVDVAYTNGRWAKWIVPPQSAWDAINEVARHRPGTIVDVVPYDTRGTLFVGQPEQSYQYTQPKHAELLTYSLLASSMVKKVQMDFGSDVIQPFLNSAWSKLYLAHYKADKAYDLNGYDWDIVHSLSDANIFVNPVDIMELDELPDEGDKASIFEKLAKNSFLTEKGPLRLKANNIIRELAGGELPAVDFTIETHWWMYSEDLRTKVEELNKISPSLVEALFIWYYDLSPTATALTIPNLSAAIKPLFFSSGKNIMEHFKQDGLYNPNTPLSVRYSAIRNATAIINSVELRQGSEEDQIKFLMTQNLITAEEANAIRKKLFDGSGQVLTRSQLNDPVLAILNERQDDSFAKIIADTGGGFRLFLFNMYHFITGELKTDNPVINESKVRGSVDRMRAMDLPPGKKIFRGYHYITIGDIIENNIKASMDEMSNCCLVRAPASEIEYEVEDGTDAEGEDSEEIIVEFDETDWRSYPTTDGIPYTYKIGKENRKLGVVYELNAIHPNQKGKTLMSNMGAMLAPMYRGNIVVIGRDIKPHDVVYINDTENDLRGHFEVESCTHHFSVGTGWVTDITPCALVRVNNPTAEIQLASMQGYLSAAQVAIDVLDVGLTIFAIVGFIFSGPTAGVIATGVRTGLGIGVNAARYTLTRGVSRKLASEALMSFGKQSLTYAKGYIPAQIRRAEVARRAARLGGSSQALAIASHLGSMVSPKGILLYGGLKLLCGAADAATSIYTKHLLSSTELPIDVHFLLYRGQPLQAGLEVDDRDIYSLFDKISGLTKEMKKDTLDFFSGLADDVAGVERNTSVLDHARESRDNR